MNKIMIMVVHMVRNNMKVTFIFSILQAELNSIT